MPPKAMVSLTNRLLVHAIVDLGDYKGRFDVLWVAKNEKFDDLTLFSRTVFDGIYRGYYRHLFGSRRLTTDRMSVMEKPLPSSVLAGLEYGMCRI